MKQTAVEWFAETIRTNRKFSWNDIFEQAKEMEKQQIIDAYNNGQQIPPFEYAEQYYKETFKNKEEPIQEILENLENQLKKVIKEHPIDVNEDTYWRGVKIGLETAVEVIKFKVW